MNTCKMLNFYQEQKNAGLSYSLWQVITSFRADVRHIRWHETPQETHGYVHFNVPWDLSLHVPGITWLTAFGSLSVTEIDWVHHRLAVRSNEN